MKSIYRTEKLTIIAFIVSLFFHTGITLYILLQTSQSRHLINKEIASIKKPLTPHQPSEPWVTTRAGNNNPVLFKNTPVSTQISSSIQETEIKEKKEEKKTPIADENDTSTQQQNDPIDFTNTKESATTRIRTTRKSGKRQSSHTERHSSQQKPLAKTFNTQKQMPTLAQLAQGFMNRVKDGQGQHLVSMLGSNKGTPSHEQLKYERYFEKLNACITNSFAINKSRFLNSPHMDYDMAILVVLNRDGTPKLISLKQSSGNMSLDHFMVSMVRDASSSFPPIPHYLPDDPLSVTLIYSSLLS